MKEGVPSGACAGLNQVQRGNAHRSEVPRTLGVSMNLTRILRSLIRCRTCFASVMWYLILRAVVLAMPHCMARSMSSRTHEARTADVGADHRDRCICKLARHHPEQLPITAVMRSPLPRRSTQKEKDGERCTCVCRLGLKLKNTLGFPLTWRPYIGSLLAAAV
jgi:hypothetical protein